MTVAEAPKWKAYRRTKPAHSMVENEFGYKPVCIMAVVSYLPYDADLYEWLKGRLSSQDLAVLMGKVKLVHATKGMPPEAAENEEYVKASWEHIDHVLADELIKVVKGDG